MISIRDIVEPVGAIIMIVVGGLGMGWFKILKETNVLLTEQNKELKNDNKEWQAKHSINEKNIASLQGQIDVLKSVPLNGIDTSLKEIAKTNANILKLLQKETK